MFYKHWKKIALTLTTFFWASCHYEDAAQPLYGVYCPPEGCEESKIESSSDGAPVSSSSEVAPPSTSSESKATSSSSIQESSSSVEALSSSSQTASSSSGEVTCTPGDSTISYYPPSYSADIAKRGAEEDAKRAGVAHIDSLKENFHAVSRCLNDLRHELNSFIALYGAPNVFPKDEVCSDGTTRLTKEYLDYLQMKEEWEKNKPALDEECQKIYDEKLKEIKQRIDKCLGDSTTTTNLTECDIEVICPDYGIESKCSGNYRCEDGVRCWDQEKDDRLFIKCSDESGKSVTYTEDEFKAKYHATF